MLPAAYSPKVNLLLVDIFLKQLFDRLLKHAYEHAGRQTFTR